MVPLDLTQSAQLAKSIKRIGVLLARYGIPAVIAVILIAALRLYNFPSFSLDDFNCVYTARREGFRKIVGHIFYPWSDFFRPLGMLVTG